MLFRSSAPSGIIADSNAAAVIMTGNNTNSLTLRGTWTNINAHLTSTSLTYKPSSLGVTALQISIAPDTTASPNNGYYYNSSNNHWYKYVSYAGFSWSSARLNASTQSSFGTHGYLATIASASESATAWQAIRAANPTNPGIWWGGTDAYSEGTWRWIGPDTFSTFFTATAAGAGSWGSAYNFGWYKIGRAHV